ncbi:TPA_asm: hypothetical protein GB173_06875 [Salmonella enterica subsp. enterica serovar Give]|uniref:Uncharacterized protein n=1 Tax=Salmonella enterica subsp. enterica serovar Give TaxID=46626 RepID=A0A6X8N8Z7_SALET|nr:hypothetical protein [Salmonella enterica subsp. enterica serovar Anatum]HAB2076561.1 hypothetical protein [Salmonella enterica subsp. enterica serovar Give]
MPCSCFAFPVIKINYTIDYTVHRTRANSDEQGRTRKTKFSFIIIAINEIDTPRRTPANTN